jgi:predicted DCC family thiol-disulfide oxidoreductase YuxK
MVSDSAHPILVYDGVCGLCHRLVQFVLARDTSDQFRFARLQGDLAATLLRRHGFDAQELDTVYLVTDYAQPGEKISARSDAVISVLRQLGGFWAAAAALLRALPTWFRDWGYRVVAGNRYRIFGKYEVCPLPREEYRHRFLDS